MAAGFRPPFPSNRAKPLPGIGPSNAGAHNTAAMIFVRSHRLAVKAPEMQVLLQVARSCATRPADLRRPSSPALLRRGRIKIPQGLAARRSGRASHFEGGLPGSWTEGPRMPPSAFTPSNPVGRFWTGSPRPARDGGSIPSPGRIRAISAAALPPAGRIRRPRTRGRFSGVGARRETRRPKCTSR
jgi:hypothetical protein